MPQEPWVLISEGGSGESRAAVAAVRALATEGYKPAVTVSGGLSLAAWGALGAPPSDVLRLLALVAVAGLAGQRAT